MRPGTPRPYVGDMKTDRHTNRPDAYTPLDVERIEDLLNRLEIGTSGCDVPGCVHLTSPVATTAESRTI